jgi:hypothetical protein
MFSIPQKLARCDAVKSIIQDQEPDLDVLATIIHEKPDKKQPGFPNSTFELADIKNTRTQIPLAALQTIVQHTPFHPENPDNERYYPNADSDAPGCYVATCINSHDTTLNRDQIRQPANILPNPPRLKQVLSPRQPGGDTAKRCQVLRRVWLSDLMYTSNSLEFPYIPM